MKRFGFVICLLFTLLPGINQVHAWYQVEAIIFEHTSPDSGNEYWDSEPGLVPLTDSVIPVHEIIHETELNAGDEVLVENPPPRLVPYMLLPAKKYRLEGVYQSLRQSREFRPIYHVSWQQPAVDGNRARAMHLQQEDNSNLFELTLPPTMVTESIPAEFYEPIRLLFDGIIRIRSSVFLHVDVDMVLFRQPPYVIPVEQPEISLLNLIPENPPAYIRLQETRRIRLNELHYFDHPMFGVILQVSRYAPD